MVQKRLQGSNYSGFSARDDGLISSDEEFWGSVAKVADAVGRQARRSDRNQIWDYGNPEQPDQDHRSSISEENLVASDNQLAAARLVEPHLRQYDKNISAADLGAGGFPVSSHGYDNDQARSIGYAASKRQIKRVREASEVKVSADEPSSKRLRSVQPNTNVGASLQGSEKSDIRPFMPLEKHIDLKRTMSFATNLSFSQADSSDEELEVCIPRAVGPDRRSTDTSTHRKTRSWWEKLHAETFKIVKDRLGPDFDFETDDPQRSWRNISSPHHWGTPIILIQWDQDTLVSKDRFIDLANARAKSRLTDQAIDRLIAKTNVLMFAGRGYLSPWTIEKYKPELLNRWKNEGLQVPVNGKGSQYSLPEVLAQADQDTFVSGKILKWKMDTAGVKLLQLVYEDQIFIMNKNPRGRSTGNFAKMGSYFRGYRKLSETQLSQLSLPASIQTKSPGDRSDTPYRNFESDLLPSPDERRPYPKGPEDFSKAFSSGFSNLKSPSDGWADEAKQFNRSQFLDERPKITRQRTSLGRD